MVRSQALWTLAATSGWSMCTSISTEPSSRPEGLARFCPARRGADPWMASNMAQLSPMLADPARPTEPAICAATSLRISPYRLGITMTSNAVGVSAILAAPISTIQTSFSMSGYCAPISSNTLWNSPSVIFMMLSFMKQVTFLRLCRRAYSKA